MKDQQDNQVKVGIPLSDMTCSFSHEGRQCPIAVSVQFESTWLCSQHFKHLRRGQEAESISFLHSVVSNPLKFTGNMKRQEHWFEEELRNYNADSDAWVDIMPKPSSIYTSPEFEKSVKAAELMTKKVSDLHEQKAAKNDLKSCNSPILVENNPWDDVFV
jgi:hypothetical protein